MSALRQATLTQPTSFPGDRRRSLRQPLAAAATIIDESASDKAIAVSVLNVSTNGVAFRAPVRFHFGSTYKLRIGPGPLHLASRLKVVDSRQRGEGIFEVGAKFV
jgi:hypothetical protein